MIWIFFKKIGGYKNISSLKFYDVWIKSVNKQKILNIENNLNEFLDSSNFLMPGKI